MTDEHLYIRALYHSRSRGRRALALSRPRT